MSKKKYLTKNEKEIISFLTKKKLGPGRIAYILNRSKRTVYNYKNYHVSKVKPTIEPEFRVEDQDLFKRMYDDFVNYQWFEHSPSMVFVNIKNKYYEKHWKKIKKWPKYKDMSKTDIIIDLRERLIKKYSNEDV